MWEKFKNIHHMFHISLVFIIFPIAGVISGEYPLLTLLWTALFIGAYYTILTEKKPFYQALSWWVMLAYIFYTSIWLNGGFVWYIFYLSNLLIYHYKEISFTSWRFWSFLAIQPAILFGVYIQNQISIGDLILFSTTFLFSDFLTLGLHRIQVAEQLKEEKSKQNAQLNLFLAENERNRIGRDLHDSLGHTFAMLSVKTELAQQFLQMKAYEQAEKEMEEVRRISKQAMADVRRIVDNLKTRTLDEELNTIRTMLEMSDIEVELHNQLNVASIPMEIQFTISMIILELVTNIIKHAEAKKSKIDLHTQNQNLILDVQDDGRGFKRVTGRELHSVRERLEGIDGTVEVISSQQPTIIRVRLPYRVKGDER